MRGPARDAVGFKLIPPQSCLLLPVWICHGPGISHFLRGSTELVAHSPTAAPRGTGNTVPKKHSVYLKIYSEKCVSIWVKGDSQQS